ncbi:MAG: tRNA (adenosine(37)-N6)-dimethylallyltransferase MiaA [Candidatus Izemoplasmatales bacterium]|jgi:tRNA dimethylallyltransferase|nr:tRNA (adenosine(37)-N6)-dimethylallyltransferase MiaA [Candidatus Izemoplasmatales bacterium]
MLDLIMIVGPTAVGKTKLSIEVAKSLNTEIINGDAMQFYKGLDIGTAKITEEEMQSIPHHLLDILNPEESFSVAAYQQLVREKIAQIKEKQNIPVIVGGSGLYLSSVVDDYQFLGKERTLDEKTYDNYTTEELARILIETKPLLAKKCDLSNRRRVLRALEKDESDVQEKLYPFYENALIIGLEIERKLLYQRIDERVDKMILNGLIEEAECLYDEVIDHNKIQAIGYKELFLYFNGEISLEEAIALIKRNSRRYAKRQMTWFKNKMNVNWFNVNTDNFDETVNEIIQFIKKRS